MTYHVHSFGDILGLEDALDGLEGKIDDHIADLDNPHQTSLVNLTDTLIGGEKVGQGLFLSEDGITWVNRASFTESWPTGLANGGELNIGPGPNDIEVIEGAGVIIDSYTDPNSPPDTIALTWNQINEPITAAPAVAGNIVWFSIANTGQQGLPIGNVPTFLGELKQYAVGPDPTLSRQEIFLGVAIFNGVTWNEVSSPKVINQAAETLREVTTVVLPISRIIAGGDITEQPGFELNQAEGTIWENNRNWHVSKSDPNREQLPAATPIVFEMVNRDFTEIEPPTSTFDPDLWDDGGTISAVPGPANTCTIQRLYIDLANNYWVLLGQQLYANWNEAQANRQAYNPVVPFLLQNSLYLGAIIAEKGKNDWDPDEATFLPPSESGGGPAAGTPITTYLGLVDTPASYTGDARKVEAVANTELALEHQYRSKYITPYSEGSPYYPQEWVSNSAWISICNTITTEPAFPQEVGDLVALYPDDPPFIETSEVAQVRSGYGVLFTKTGEVRSLEVWVPEITTDITYALVIIDEPNGSTPSLTRIPLRNDQLTAAAWSSVAVGNRLYVEGAEVLVYLESLNQGGSSTVTGGWQFNGQQNTAPPLDQGWNHNNAKTIVRIDKNDLDGTDRSTELLGIVTGSTLQFAETASPTNAQIYITLAPPQDLGTYYEYSVTLTNETGVLVSGVVTTFTGTVPVAQATKFVFQADKFLDYPDWADITSFLQYDDVDQVVPDTIGYGINFNFQQLSKSDDWDLIPVGGGGASGGGGETPSGGGATEVEVTQVGHGFSNLTCIRWDGVEWVLAQANNADTTALGVVVEVVNPDIFKYAITGAYELETPHGLTIDQWYYLSDTTPGGLDIDEPIISQPIVYIETDTKFSVYAYRPLYDYSNDNIIEGAVPTLVMEGSGITINGTDADVTYPMSGVQWQQNNNQYFIYDGTGFTVRKACTVRVDYHATVLGSTGVSYSGLCRLYLNDAVVARSRAFSSSDGTTSPGGGINTWSNHDFSLWIDLVEGDVGEIRLTPTTADAFTVVNNSTTFALTMADGEYRGLAGDPAGGQPTATLVNSSTTNFDATQTNIPMSLYTGTNYEDWMEFDGTGVTFKRNCTVTFEVMLGLEMQTPQDNRSTYETGIYRDGGGFLSKSRAFTYHRNIADYRMTANIMNTLNVLAGEKFLVGSKVFSWSVPNQGGRSINNTGTFKITVLDYDWIKGDPGKQGEPGEGANQNLLINGGFTVCQRSNDATPTFPVGSREYTLDRWQKQGTEEHVRGTDIPDISRSGEANAVSAYSLNARNSSEDYLTARQGVELQTPGLHYPFQEGGTYTMSGWFKSVLGEPLNLRGAWVEEVGVVGGRVIDFSEVFLANPVPDEWTYVEYTFTLSTDPTPTCVALEFNFSITETATPDSIIKLHGVKIERGDKATAFERDIGGDELAKCQRYYQTNNIDASGTIFGFGYSQTNSVDYGSIQFATQMRADPTVEVVQSNNSGQYGDVTLNTARRNYLRFGATCNTTGNSHWWALTYTADAEL